MTPATRLWWAIPLALFVSICSSCNHDIPHSSFVRTYETDHTMGSETLTLNSDSTYRHHFKSTSGSEVTSSGKWEVVKVGRKQRILVRNFIPYFPGRPQVASDWLLEPYQTFGYLRLYVSREPRQFYLELPEKQ